MHSQAGIVLICMALQIWDGQRCEKGISVCESLTKTNKGLLRQRSRFDESCLFAVLFYFAFSQAEVSQRLLLTTGDARNALFWSRCRFKTSTAKPAEHQSEKGTFFVHPTLQELLPKTGTLHLYRTAFMPVMPLMKTLLLLCRPKALPRLKLCIQKKTSW